jgi:hypothetical protein
VRDSIIEQVEEQIVSRVMDCRSNADWNTKFDVLSAVSGIMKGAVSLPQDGGWHDCSQSASPSEALVSALIKVGKRLSDAEIAQVREETQLLKALEAATKFEIKWSGEQSFKDIA